MSHLITPELRNLCIDRMREAYDPGSGMFSRQLRNRRWERTEGTEEITSTAICLIAASRAGVDAAQIGIDVAPTIRTVFDQCASRYPGGLGLAIWMNAAWDGDSLTAILRARGLSARADSLAVHSMTTMEASWMLCGLLHEQARSPEPAVTALVDEVRSEILTRFHERNRLFRHSAAFFPPKDWLRKNVANFADQVYSVMAFSFDRLAGGVRASGDLASACMDRLIELQGPLGQWWWHYDPSSGDVAGRFPVYSVHQHGMAPIALTAVSRANGRDHSATIEKSFGWLSGNELGVGMIDLDGGTIWRDIEPRVGRVGRLARQAGMIAGFRETGAGPAGPLEVNHETRPYEWGWCIYFGSLDTKPPGGTHLV